MRKRSITIAVFFVFLYFLFRVVGFNWIENLELVSLNFRMYLRGEIEHSNQVKIVAIDDRSLSELYYEEENPWPWRRSVYAKLIEKLSAAQAKSIVMDISFDTYNSNDMEGDRLFAESLFMHPYVTMGTYLVNNEEEFNQLTPEYQQKLADNSDHLRFRYKFTNPDRYSIPAFFSPYLLVPPETLFMNSTWAYATYEIGLPGEDGMFRTVPLVVNERFLNDQESGSMVLLPTIDILGLCAYFDIEPGNYVFDMKKNEIHLGEARSIPVDVNGYFTINFYGKKPFDEISVVDVLKKEASELEDYFKDKIVLIGCTARSKGLFDLRPTPFNKNESGIQIHATLMQNIVDENYLIRAPFWINLIIIFIVLAISSSLLLLPHLRVSIILDITFAILYNLLNYLLFLQNIWIDLLYPNLILAVFLLYNTILRVYQENKERLQTKKYFAKYVPAQVVEAILRDPAQINLGGKKMEISVLFCDIIGFTTISEQLDPEELVLLLNEYFTEMTAIIKDQYGGTLDKFVGDSIVAIFGAPFKHHDDPLRAVRAALAMRDKALELQERWKVRGEKVFFGIGVGISTGFAVVGNIGSPDRLNYTCVGDTVNVAARLEAATRDTQTTILISSATYDYVKDYFDCTKIPSLQVKGKKEALTVYAVNGQEIEKAQALESS